jgi:uncharacterized protein (UPF0333 family)
VVAAIVLMFVLLLAFLAVSYTPPLVGQENTNHSQPPIVEANPSPASLEWWTSNAINQINAQTQEAARQYLSNYYNTCGPTVVAMLTNYYRAQTKKTKDQITPADVLHDARSKLGYYTPPYNSGLLEFHNLRDLFGLYGIVQAYPDGDAWISFNDLVERVRKGNPAVVGMRYSYQGEDAQYLPSGGSGLYDHFVIVFSTAEENGKGFFWLFNPHPGKYLDEDSQAVPVKIGFDEFKRSWQLNDGSRKSEYGPAAFYRVKS